MLLFVFLYLLDSGDIMMWLWLWKCCWYVFMIMRRDWLLEMKQYYAGWKLCGCVEEILICAGTNRLVLESFPDQSIKWSFWVMESEQCSGPIDCIIFLYWRKWIFYRTNRLILDSNRLHELTDLKIGNSYSCQSIDTQHQSIDPLHSLKNRYVR